MRILQSNADCLSDLLNVSGKSGWKVFGASLFLKKVDLFFPDGIFQTEFCLPSLQSHLQDTSFRSLRSLFGKWNYGTDLYKW